ncbi:MAG: hypothetical protein ABIF85_05475 [Nanoarchaeota archaeon]
MSLNLVESIARVDESQELKTSLTDAYFCSAITFVLPEEPIEYWDLNYYNPKTGDITHIRASSDSLELKSTDKPLKQKEPKKIDIKTVCIDIDETIKTAGVARDKIYASAIQKIFVSLFSEEFAIWGITYILTNMKIVQIKIDARNGSVIDSKLIDFMQNTGIAQ